MSLLIGYHIKEVLTKNDIVVEDVDNRIYPLVIPVGTPEYPFIVFRNDGITTDGTKDGTCEDSVNVSVIIVTKDYMQAIELANTVRYSFEDVQAEYQQFQVNDCVVTGSSEEYLMDIDAVAITLGFNFKTVDY